MKVNKIQLLIIAFLITVSVSLYWLLKPGLEVRPIPPTIVDSEIGEKQIIAITIKNTRPLPIKIIDTHLVSDRHLWVEYSEKGIILDDCSFAYKFLSRGNPYWNEVKTYSLEEVEIGGYQEFNIYFLTQLHQKIGIIEGADLNFTYLNRNYNATIEDINIALLAESADDDLRKMTRKSYPGRGSNIRHNVIINTQHIIQN